MRKITLGLSMLSLALSAQNNDAGLDRDGFPSATLSVSAQPLVQTQSISTVYGESRPLSELNTSVGEGHPWISSDGLRLYYTHGLSADTELFFSQRPDTNSDFEAPVSIPIGLHPNSVWLSEDELDLWVIGSPISQGFYHCQRPTVSAPFSVPVPISLNGIPLLYYNGPSLNIAQDTLWLISAGSFMQFARTSDTSFGYVSTILAGDVGAGKLSKDELHYIMGIASPETDQSSLYQITRSSTAVPFEPSTLEALEGFDEGATNVIQPATSANLEWIVYVQNNQKRVERKRSVHCAKPIIGDKAFQSRQ